MKQSLVIIAIIMLAFGCGSKETVDNKSTVNNKLLVNEEPVIIEIEDFTLSNCTLVDDAKAGGGKAAKFDNAESTAVFETKLKPGDYRMNIRVNAYGPENDGFFATVNASGQKRVWCNTNYGFFALTQYVLFTVGDDGIARILLEASETGMIVDRVIIEKASGN